MVLSLNLSYFRLFITIVKEDKNIFNDKFLNSLNFLVYLIMYLHRVILSRTLLFLLLMEIEGEESEIDRLWIEDSVKTVSEVYVRNFLIFWNICSVKNVTNGLIKIFNRSST